MKKFTITADIRVKNELLEAKVFFDSRIKGLGLKFLKDYRNSLSKLKTNPFYEIRYDAVRCLPLETFKFMIHFKVDESQNNVLVLAVISTHKDPNASWISDI